MNRVISVATACVVSAFVTVSAVAGDTPTPLPEPPIPPAPVAPDSAPEAPTVEAEPPVSEPRLSEPRQPGTEPAAADDRYYSRYQLEGMASWYGGKFQGRLTANGEVFDTNQLTAAHRELPFGTIVRVTNKTNNRVVVVRINDRGPFVDNRVIDLSRAAADIIGLTAAGVAPVQLEIMHYQPQTDLRTIQIGSFGRRSNADAVASRLTNAGIPAVIETVATAGVHRVIVQGVPEAEVPELQGELASLGYQNVLIRQK